MMKRFSLALVMLFVTIGLMAQEKWNIHPAQVGQMIFLGETQAYRDWDPHQKFRDERTRDREEEEDDEGRRGHPHLNPNSLPIGLDPAWQTNYPAARGQHALGVNQNGQGFTSVYPSDNILDVGPNHVIQMINGSSGAYFRIYDKSGTALGAQVYLDNFTGSAGGYGDPVVLYDALADRWLMSEFAASGNHFLVAVSTTSDPTGTWYAYNFTTPQFPDYPKYAVWQGMYIVTSNESTPAIYALDRTKMLVGDGSATFQRFSVPSYGSIGFQATTPVTFDGGTAPPTGAPGMFMRMADDGWSGATADQLEMWTMDIDFSTPGNSVVNGPTTIPTAAFDSDLCGYTTLNCIPQPGTSTKLDPIREVLMNRIQYRNFGSHEAIVCDHSVDVTGSDRAGVRWYELRRTGGIGNPWSIYQQGTYSPDADNRWMGMIAINASGDIGLAYNVSSGSTYPSVRYTGRHASDPLGTMSEPETTVIAGSGSNGNNRYGDYNSLDVDPSDGATFWGTGQYNASSSWSTRIFSFSLPATTPDYSLDVTNGTASICQPNNAAYSIQVGSILGYNSAVTLSTSGLPAGANASFSTNPVTPAGTSTLTISNTGAVAPGSYMFDLNASSAGGPKSLSLTLVVGATPGQVTLLSPANGATDVTGPLTWNTQAAAASYTIQIATDAAMTNIVETASGLTATSYMPSTANQGSTTYYWRVRGVSTCGNGTYSAIWSYTYADCQSVSVKIVLDRYGSETTWNITDAGNNTYASGGPYTDQASNGAYPQSDVVVCLPPGCYTLTVNDAYGDGICCAYGSGAIWVSETNGPPLCTAISSFTTSAQANFCVGASCIGTFPWTEDFESGTGQWIQGAEDDMDWTLLSGSTQSSNTGPSGDHTTGSGNYLYTEASSPNYPSKLAELYGPCIDLAGFTSATLTFWYHMYGATMGTLNVSVWNGSSWSGDLFSLSGDQGNSWQQATVDLAAFVGGTVRLRFQGTTGSNYTSDMAIDDIQIDGLAQAGVQLAVKSMLEGPYESGTGLMRDDLRVAGLIPTTEPYTALGYGFAGGGGETVATSVLNATGNNAIVDWIVVELRSGTDNTSVVASQAGLLQRDGDIVATDGTSPLTFSVPTGDYFVAVRHRNHLGTMTANTVALGGSVASVDLTVPATPVYGTQARKDVSGTQLLWAGDATFNHQLKYAGSGNDRDAVLVRVGGTVPTATVSGYFIEDVNLSGVVKYAGATNDRDPILVNIGGTVPTATRTEQLP
ncbi:MAG: hypothetical protein H6597_03415 [Flavobacteriales bacterium]|nr:hypothetical protein [Flavobacteriales bacterium]MCB9193556.1 hypothetical protein [Flavobacteriales bacterium]